MSVESALAWLEAYEEAERNGTNQRLEDNQQNPSNEEAKENNLEQPMEVEKTKTQEEENSQRVRPGERPVRALKKVTKEEFHKDTVNKFLQDLSKHIISNIFFFEGYESKVLELVQYSLETQENDAKKLMAQEIAVITYKLLKHNVNNFTKGTKFLSNFKVSKSFEKSIIFTKESLHKVPSHKLSILPKLRAINTVLPWFNHFLNYIPNMEKNLLKSDFVTELLRFFEHMIKEVDDAKESPDDQEMLYEIANTVTEKFFQTLFVVLKLKNSLEDSKRESKKDTKENKGEKSPKRDPKVGTEPQTLTLNKESSQITTEKDAKEGKSTIQQGKASKTKEASKEGEKEKETQGGSQQVVKKGLVELMINILSQSEHLSLKHKRSIIFHKNSLCLYMRVLNLMLANNLDNVKMFIEKKGLQELLKYKLDSREPKGADFLKEFTDVCLSLVSEPTLNIITLECEIKAFFYHLPEHKTKLRTFTEHFKEQHNADPETFMNLVKQLCIIEDKDKAREKPKRLDTKGSVTQDQEEAETSPTKQNRLQEQQGQSSKGPERLERRRTLGASEEQNKNKKQSMVISLKSEIEYSRLNSLSPKGEDVKNVQPSFQLKKRRRSNKPEEMKEDEISNHILDFVPPSNALHVIRTLINNLIQQFNMEINDETNKVKTEKGEQEFYPIFSYSLILISFQVLFNKHPILSQPILRQNVTRTCKATLKNPSALKNLDTSKNISFLSYFLRIIIFSTMDLYRNFLFSICSSTNLIVDKDKSGNPYPTPYFFDLKRKIISEIYQILEEEVAAKPFYKTKDNKRLFCSVSGLLFYLLPLKDIARFIYDNKEQYNFLKVYTEALKQLKVGNYEHLEKLSSFVSEPLSILIQYHHYFAINKENPDEKAGKDIWMPKKSLQADHSFNEEWNRIINPALKGEYSPEEDDWTDIDEEEDDEDERTPEGSEEDDDDDDERESEEMYGENEEDEGDEDIIIEEVVS